MARGEKKALVTAKFMLSRASQALDPIVNTLLATVDTS